MEAPLARATATPRRQDLPTTRFDLAMIGGGLVGLARTRALGRESTARLVLLEAEGRLAAHQSGHNSGVIHAGLYDPSGSLRARLCQQGRAELLALLARCELPHAVPGKLILARGEQDLPRLAELARQGQANGLDGLELMDRADLAELLAPKGARRLVVRLLRRGLGEWLRSHSEAVALSAMRHLLPGLRACDVEHAGSGVRAQAVSRRGELLSDFVIREGSHSLHVLNAPSPAASASLAIDRHLAQRARDAFGL